MLQFKLEPKGSLASAYRGSPHLRRVARALTLASLYRAVSYYGSSYRRAAAVLLLLVAVFGLVFALVGDLHVNQQPVSMLSLASFRAGMTAALEVAVFQRDPMVEIRSVTGKAVRLIEAIAIPGQVAMLLLAIRRRFKR